MNTTANRIKKLRKKAGLNQSQLAQQTGISEQSISKYERGKRNPKIENLEALANFFKVPVSYLRGETAVNRLKELRQENNLTLRQLGEKLDMKNSTLSQYETGKREPKLETWKELANYFNVSVPYLLGLEDKTENKEKHKANIFVWTYNDEITERHEVDDYEIDDNIVIATEAGEKWIYPLTSIMSIEVLNKK